METVNWEAFQVLLPALVVFVVLGTVIYRIEKAQRLENKFRERTLNELYSALEKVPYNGSIPPVAVERFLGYIKCPDPSFDAAAIIQQELNNQLGGPRGGAIVKTTEYKTRSNSDNA